MRESKFDEYHLIKPSTQRLFVKTQYEIENQAREHTGSQNP
jgi:hypothetical protein